MPIVRLADVVAALQETLGRKGMLPEQLEELANFIMSFFGYKDRIVDNRLTAQERDVFYMLEEAGLLTTAQEEVTLHKGRKWRIHYWVLKRERILALADERRRRKRTVKEGTVYDTLSEDVWTRRDP
ncbi:MAG: DUF6015 family protein [Candidatus Thermoplasmatota archaeon]